MSGERSDRSALKARAYLSGEMVNAGSDCFAVSKR
jgi:hypothetical protein